MNDPTPESLALVDEIWKWRHFEHDWDAHRAISARRIDAYVAKRTAELRKIIHDQSEAHVAHMKGVDEANERRLDAYKARLDDLRAALDAYPAPRPETVEVPVEPTQEMVHDGGLAYDHPSLYMGGPSQQGQRTAKRIYASMIAARPTMAETGVERKP